MHQVICGLGLVLNLYTSRKNVNDCTLKFEPMRRLKEQWVWGREVAWSHCGGEDCGARL